MSKKFAEMINLGLHFGHEGSKFNPKMEPYVYGRRQGIHIIDLVQTNFYLRKVSKFLTKSARQNKTFLFVGTKKEASALIADTATQCDSFFVNQRWLGGIFTNWKTMKTSIAKLKDLEMKEEQGEFKRLPKKEAAACKKEKERLNKYLGGLKKMSALPDVVIIVGQPEEMNTVRESQKLDIKSVTIIDTDCDPSLTDLFVPANDDSEKSLNLILNIFSASINKGREEFGFKPVSPTVDSKTDTLKRPSRDITITNLKPASLTLNPKVVSLKNLPRPLTNPKKL